jgi:hypothetical protein
LPMTPTICPVTMLSVATGTYAESVHKWRNARHTPWHTVEFKHGRRPSEAECRMVKSHFSGGLVKNADRVVLMYRDEASNAASNLRYLQKSGRTEAAEACGDPQHSYAARHKAAHRLWYCMALTKTMSFPLKVVEYSKLLRDPRGELERILTFLEYDLRSVNVTRALALHPAEVRADEPDSASTFKFPTPEECERAFHETAVAKEQTAYDQCIHTAATALYWWDAVKHRTSKDRPLFSSLSEQAGREAAALA